MASGDRDLKAEAIRGGVRDLKIDDAAAAAMRGSLKMKEAAAMGGGDQGLKMKEAAAMGGGDQGLKMKEAAAMWGGDQCLTMQTEMKDAGGSEGGDTLKRKPWEVEGAILKLKKDVLRALDRWYQIQSLGRKSRMDEALGARKKKMKVVKTKFSKGFIDKMAVFSWTVCKDLSDEELAQWTPFMREVYAAIKVYEAKNREYWDVLAAQQKEMGYAEDEIEVTDDDEEEEAAVVKN